MTDKREIFSVLIKFDTDEGEEMRLYYFGTHAARQAFVKFVSWAVGKGYELHLTKVYTEKPLAAEKLEDQGIQKTLARAIPFQRKAKSISN